MKKLSYVIAISAFLLISCEKSNNTNVVSQNFVHKYGFDVSEKEWKDRNSEGQVVSVLKTGITVNQTYSNGILHGPTTYSYPHSNIVHKCYLYEEGSLLKIVVNDHRGIPYFEEAYEYDNKRILTFWNQTGVPLKKEEYENNQLVYGQYFDSNNQKESSIENGTGIRINRNRKGVLLSKDLFQDGKLLTRTGFYENGTLQSETSYSDYILNGEQKKYSTTGNIALQQTWNKGKLDGLKVLYKDNTRVAEIPYMLGKKDGVEKHYHLDGTLAGEVHWVQGQKHGSDRKYENDETKIKWFFRGENIAPGQFELKEFEEKMLSELKDNYLNYPLEVADLTTDEDSKFEEEKK
jgi:antitoxin component YwqK of YwqJK toxin-antitoxin module